MIRLLVIFTMFATILITDVNAVMANSNSNTKLQSNIVTSDGGVSIRVKGTNLASLHSVMDVMTQMTGIHFVNGEFYVEGRGVAEVYINNRKVTDYSELWHTLASDIVSVRLIRQPGVEYSKNVRAVILIVKDEIKDEGFNLDEHLRFDYTDRMATNNELTLGYKKNMIDVNGFLGWNEKRTTIYQTPITYIYDPDTHILNYALKSELSPRENWQQLTARLNTTYNISKTHQISLGYSYLRVPNDKTEINEIILRQYGAVNNAIDFSNPQDESRDAESDRVNQTRHTTNLEYRGMLNKWTLYAGNNSYWDNYKSKAVTLLPGGLAYTLKEFESRSYVKAVLPTENGALNIGVENEYNNMNVLYNSDADETMLIHSDNTSNVFSVYTSIDQKFGDWTVSAGLRYEHTWFEYKPYGDDALARIAQWVWKLYDGDITKFYGWEESLVGHLVVNGKYTTRNDDVAPTLSIARKLGSSTITLSYTQSYNRPYLAITRIGIADIETPEAKIINTEKIQATSLNWEWKWLAVNTTYSQFTNPVCMMGSMSGYNGPSYEALDVNVTASPTVGVWKTSLMMHLHKQWFDMQLPNGSHDMSTPLLNLQINNTITLPHYFLIRLNAIWSSKGYDRNVKFYSTNLNMNCAIQKVFPRQKLTIELLADNILRNSWTDKTTYNIAAHGSSSGTISRNPRTVSLSFRYTL